MYENNLKFTKYNMIWNWINRQKNNYNKSKKKYKLIFLLLLVLFSIFYIYNLKKNYGSNNTSLWLSVTYNNKINKTLNNSFTWINKKNIINNKNKISTKTKKIEIEYDFITDNSITKYISPDIHFKDIKYEPDDLILIDSEYILNLKKWMILRKEAFNSLKSLSEDFYNHFNIRLSIFSAYRNYNYQKWIKDWWCPDSLCAKAWYSEHQTWLAIDIFDATTNEEFLSNNSYKKYYEWMKLNAYKYGFHNSYQNWIDIDWYNIEPWHWRYLWKELAKELYNKNITLSQYYFSKK